MNIQHGLSSETVAKIRAVFSRFPQVERAILYGSRANGTSRPGSDIDLVLCGRQLDHHTVGQIDDALDDLLLPYRFDLSIFEKVTHAELLDHIKRVGVTFYEGTPVEVKHF